MRCVKFLWIFCLFIKANFSVFAVGGINNEITVVEKVIHIENAGADLRIAKNSAVSIAKTRAINELHYQYKCSNVELNNIDIDSCIESFQIANEAFSNNEYVADVTFYFDLYLFNNIICNPVKSSLNDSTLTNNVLLEIVTYNQQDFITKWSKISFYILKNKINIKNMHIAHGKITLSLDQLNVKHFEQINSSFTKDVTIINQTL